MNILVTDLPTTVTIDGHEYVINTDYRAALRTIMAFEDDDLTVYEKTLIMLTNLYPSIPTDTQAAITQAQLFLNGGEEQRDAENKPRVFSFSKDARLIFAAFHQTHGINLQNASLHWFEFLALFMDLGQDTTFCQLTALRARIKSGKATKEERKMARDMGDLFDLPEVDDRSQEEKEAHARFMALIEQGRQRKKNNG